MESILSSSVCCDVLFLSCTWQNHFHLLHWTCCPPTLSHYCNCLYANRLWLEQEELNFNRNVKERSLFISKRKRESENEANHYWLYSRAYCRFRPLRSTSYCNARRPVNSYTPVGSTSHPKIYPSFFTHEYNNLSKKSFAWFVLRSSAPFDSLWP